MKKQLGFFVNSSVCSGCKTCQTACKDKQDHDVGLLWRRIYEIAGGSWVQDGNAWIPGVFAYHLSISCNHCEDPLCVKACPTKALYKREDGIVLIDQNKCMGCRYCEWACPYGSPQYNKKTGTMTKCHLCHDRIDKNRKPVCVESCPMRALDFGPLDHLRKKYSGSGEIYPLPKASYTKPAVVIKPHQDAEKAKKDKAEIANAEEV